MLPKILIRTAVTSDYTKFFGQAEYGEIFPDCEDFPDDNEEICLMHIQPARFEISTPLNEVEDQWQIGGKPSLIEVELSGLETEAIQKILPQGVRWFIEKTNTKTKTKTAK